MKRPPIRVLDLAGSPEQIGHTHGTTFAGEIRRYTEERIDLVMSGRWSGGPMSRADVLDLADSMVPAHMAHDEALAAEMLAMADAAGLTPAEAVVVGGFTDFVDTVRAAVGGPHPAEIFEDDCTAVIVPDERADGAGFYAQTWDMHDTATDFVVLLRIRPDDGPASLVFTTTGALGQIGMSEHGVCVGINNLVATDGRPGVTWPQVVRKALQASDAAGARDAILDADLAGGHNFMVFDAAGDGYNIEAMPSARPVTPLTDDVLAHTNHTLTPETDRVQGPLDAVQEESTTRRLKVAQEFFPDSGVGPDHLMALTREESAICRHPEPPYHVESSGAAVMRPKTGDFWAVWGVPDLNEYQKIEFA